MQGQNSSQVVTGAGSQAGPSTNQERMTHIVSKSSNYNISLNSKSFYSKNNHAQTISNIQVD